MNNYPSARRLSRRHVLKAAGLTLGLAGAAGALGSLSACAPGPAPTGPGGGTDPALSIGFVPIACSAPLLIADAEDLFTRHGVTVQLKKYSGWADLWTAYATRELDVAHMLSPMPVAINAGATDAARPTELAFTQNTNGQALTLATRHVDSVREATDLRGMVLGIPFEYSVHALLLRDYLVTGGLDPVADVELRLLRPADMVAQLEVGTIDGFIGPEPFNQRALQSGAGRMFILTKQMWDGHPCCSVALAQDFRREHPTESAALVAALDEAAQLLDDPANAAELSPVLAQEKYLNQAEHLITPGLTGHYTDWEGREQQDPDYLRYGDATDPTAITWMSAQIARWGLGGDAIRLDNPESIRAAATAVLPADLDTPAQPVTVNGTIFDPAHPTEGYQ